MPVKKINLEVFDEHGNRYKITCEGHVTRDKALRLLDLVELLGGVPDNNHERNLGKSSKFDKVQLIVEKHFPIAWFSTKDVQLVYEKKYNEPINLSTVSTYLSRMNSRGILSKRRVSNRRQYKVIRNVPKNIINFNRLNF
jgi:hypothetical protein